MHNPEQEILLRYSSFSYRLPAVHGDDVIVPLAIVVFLELDTIITQEWPGLPYSTPQKRPATFHPTKKSEETRRNAITQPQSHPNKKM